MTIVINNNSYNHKLKAHGKHQTLQKYRGRLYFEHLLLWPLWGTKLMGTKLSPLQEISFSNWNISDYCCKQCKRICVVLSALMMLFLPCLHLRGHEVNASSKKNEFWSKSALAKLTKSGSVWWLHNMVKQMWLAVRRRSCSYLELTYFPTGDP